MNLIGVYPALQKQIANICYNLLLSGEALFCSVTWLSVVLVNTQFVVVRTSCYFVSLSFSEKMSLFPFFIFLPSLAAPVCFSLLKKSRGLFVLQPADWFEKLYWQALSGGTTTRGGNLLKLYKSLMLIHADRQHTEMMWLKQVARNDGRGGKQRPMSICWLVQFACYSFLSGSAGSLQRQFLTVIKRDSFHPRTQFSVGQLIWKRKWKGNICCGTPYRPPLSKSIQLNINGMDVGRTWSLSIEKQLTTCGGASCCRKICIPGSLAKKCLTCLYSPCYAFFFY